MWHKHGVAHWIGSSIYYKIKLFYLVHSLSLRSSIYRFAKATAFLKSPFNSGKSSLLSRKGAALCLPSHFLGHHSVARHHVVCVCDAPVAGSE